jgi:hypothetical protein
MKQKIFSHFQDYMIQYISHDYARIVVRVEDIVHDPKGSALQPWPLYGIVIANTTLLYAKIVHLLCQFLAGKVGFQLSVKLKYS